MAIKDQFSNVFQKTGVACLYNGGLSGESFAYLDIELPSGTAWRGKFVRKFSMSSVPPTVGNDIVNGTIVFNSQDSKNYLVTNLQYDFLVNEAIYKQGELFRCNVSGEIFVFSSGGRSSDYKVDGQWLSLQSGEYFCLVPNRLDLVEKEPALNLVDTMYMYSPESLDVQVDHRVTIFNPTIQNYRVKTVDCLSMEGIKIVELETDKR